MSLSDIMSGSGLSSYAEAGLILFLLCFVAITVWVFSKKNDLNWDSASRMPLDDGTLVRKMGGKSDV